MNLDTDVKNLFELQLSMKDNGGLDVYNALPFIEGGVEVDGEIEEASMERPVSSFSSFVDASDDVVGPGVTPEELSDTVKLAHSFKNDKV